MPMGGNPGTVSAGAAALGGLAEPFTSGGENVRSAGNEMASSWTGQAGVAARQDTEQLGMAYLPAAQALRAAAPVLTGYAQALTAAQLLYAQGEALLSNPYTAAEGRALMAQATMMEQQANAAAAGQIQSLTGQLTGTGPEQPPAPPEKPDTGWSWSDIGHTVLDVVGLVPVLGEPADLINAGWYAKDGDYVSAGLSLGSALPIAGWGFAGGKFGVKAVRGLKDAKLWMRGRPPMVPSHATREAFEASSDFARGEKFAWTDAASGKKVSYWAHGADPKIAATQNAGQGPIYRMRIGNHYADGQGNLFTKNSLNPKSPAFDPAAANATHIPYPKDLPAPGATRFAAPNPLSLADGVGDGGGGR